MCMNFSYLSTGIFIPTVRILGQQYAKKYKQSTKLIRINPRDYEVDEELGFSVPFSSVEGITKILKG
jgi:hypothetical protein